MSALTVAAAKQAEKLNTLFPSLSPLDATPAPAAQLTDHTAHHNAWEALWADSTYLPWERGAPHPALYDALTLRKDVLGDAMHAPGQSGSTGKRRTALVPGCGRAYDVFLLRAFGYDATGVEVSRSAIKEVQKVREKVDNGQGPGEGKWEGVGYGVQDDAIGLGTAEVVRADFFKMEGDGTWDLIFDHTFLSALPPSLRPQWSAALARLLSPTGRLICAEFPTTKPTDSGGPPWGLPEEVYLAHLQHPGVTHVYDDAGKVVFDKHAKPSSGGLERIARWRPERTHEAGTGKDWMSVWRHVE